MQVKLIPSEGCEGEFVPCLRPNLVASEGVPLLIDDISPMSSHPPSSMSVPQVPLFILMTGHMGL